VTFNPAPRRKFTTLQRAAFFRDHGGICYLCGGKINAAAGEAWEIEHVIAREIMGRDADEDSNLALAHKKCHASKTAQDRRTIAKSNQVQAKHIGARPPSRWPQRPKSPRREQHSATRPIVRTS